MGTHGRGPAVAARPRAGGPALLDDVRPLTRDQPT